ncbi:MAG: hypothetical protein WCS94_14135, partial [Verrucomicrobiota bacterium]
PLAPQASALAGLRYAPNHKLKGFPPLRTASFRPIFRPARNCKTINNPLKKTPSGKNAVYESNLQQAVTKIFCTIQNEGQAHSLSYDHGYGV